MIGPAYTSRGINPPRHRRSRAERELLDPDIPRGLLKTAIDQHDGIHSATGTGPLPPPPASVRHLNETDLARRWRMSVRTLQSWRWKRVGPPWIKAMGRVLYRLSDIEMFEVEHLRGPGS